MTLMKSKQPPVYRWRKGDLLTAKDACELLGYKSGSVLQIPDRRKNLAEEFNRLRLPLTLDIWIGGGQRFIKKEFDDFIEAKVGQAQKRAEKQRDNFKRLRIAA